MILFSQDYTSLLHGGTLELVFHDFLSLLAMDDSFLVVDDGLQGLLAIDDYLLVVGNFLDKAKLQPKK